MVGDYFFNEGKIKLKNEIILSKNKFKCDLGIIK